MNEEDENDKVNTSRYQGEQTTEQDADEMLDLFKEQQD